MLKERLRQALVDQAQTGNPTTYQDLADSAALLGLRLLRFVSALACRPPFAAPGLPPTAPRICGVADMENRVSGDTSGIIDPSNRAKRLSSSFAATRM